MRGFDRDLIRGGHYGQRTCEPHLQAEHMAAPTQACLREDFSCQPGAVHTWHKADVAGLSAFRRIIMTSGEKIGAALAKALKSAAAEWKKGEQAPVMYRTNLRDVPKVDGLKRDDG